MRTKLADLGNDQRYTFTGIFKKYGYKRYRNHYSPTLVLNNVQYNGSTVTDHLWFNLTKQFQKLGLLHEGDQIQFNARVNMYEKGYYLEREIDYDLSYPTKIQLVESYGKSATGKESGVDDGKGEKENSNNLKDKTTKEDQETEKDCGAIEKNRDGNEQVAEAKSEKYQSDKKCVADQHPEIPDDNNTIIGMIMDLNFDFYHVNNRPLDNYYLDMFRKWQTKHPLGIKCHHLSNNENIFYSSL